MIAFGGNSVLARLALVDGAMDAASYSGVRLISGAVMLCILVGFGRNGSTLTKQIAGHGNWISAAALFGYAAAFSFAYLQMDTGLGALVLFACVQATMIAWGVAHGQRPNLAEWAGIVLAFGAFTQLVAPISLSDGPSSFVAPPLVATLLMAISGIAWGIYTLRGRAAPDALLATTGNFVRSVPMALVLSITAVLAFDLLTISTSGMVLAIASGAITSALGYALWYACQPSLSPTTSAVVQLSAPAIATLGGVIFAGEALTLRFVVCSVLILGGIALTILAKNKPKVV